MDANDDLEPTFFRVPVDAETFDSLMEQAAKHKIEPRMLMAAILRSALRRARTHGLNVVIVPNGSSPPSTSKH